MTTFLETTEIMEFALLLPAQSDRMVRDVIVSFLAVLELAKLKFIEIIQTETFGPIQIRAVRPLRELNAGLLDSY
jgi:chromatin segregation and condensation protein Rec8/ScpA/Scc1 (kleisin family)